MSPTEKDLELRDYLGILWRRKVIVVLAVVLVAGAAFAAAVVQTSIYEGVAEVLLQPRSTESLFDSTPAPADPSQTTATEIHILQSLPVRAAVVKQLGSAPRISANAAGDTQIIQVRADSPDPARAAKIANAYANSYIDYRRTQAVGDILAATNQVQAKIQELQGQIDQATGTEKDSLQQAQTVFRQKLDELSVDGALKTGGAQLVTPAVASSVPIKPRPKRSAATGAGIGLLMGVALAFLINYLDDSVKTKDDLEKASRGVATIGLIPAVEAWKNRSEARAVSIDEPTSPTAEAYRTLRTSIQFLALDHPVGIIEVTSANAGEGKTTTLANLGVVLARAGQRVVLVCCDLRRPRIHEFFGMSNDVGLTSVLLGRASLSEAVQKVPDVNRLFLLASGPVPPNPSEVLMSKRVGQTLDALRNEGYVVLIDSPPVLPVTDAAVLSRFVDGTVLVCAAGQTSGKAVGRAIELLEQVNAPLMGSVLNGVSTDGAYGYDYKYKYRYAHQKVEPPQPARVKVRK